MPWLILWAGLSASLFQWFALGAGFRWLPLTDAFYGFLGCSMVMAVYARHGAAPLMIASTQLVPWLPPAAVLPVPDEDEGAQLTRPGRVSAGIDMAAMYVIGWVLVIATWPLFLLTRRWERSGS